TGTTMMMTGIGLAVIGSGTAPTGRTATAIGTIGTIARDPTTGTTGATPIARATGITPIETERRCSRLVRTTGEPVSAPLLCQIRKLVRPGLSAGRYQR